MAITRKLESRVKLAPKDEGEELVEVKADQPAAKQAGAEDPKEAVRTKRVCQFCTQNTKPDYSDSSSLRRYMSDRGRIQPRARTGVCAKHQRGLSRQIKYARHLSLLPFTVRV